MAKQKALGTDIILIIAALFLLVLALNGNAGSLFSKIYNWLTGGTPVPPAKTTKTTSTPKSTGGTKATTTTATTNPLTNLWPFGTAPGKTTTQPNKQTGKSTGKTVLPNIVGQIYPSKGATSGAPANAGELSSLAKALADGVVIGP